MKQLAVVVLVCVAGCLGQSTNPGPTSALPIGALLTQSSEATSDLAPGLILLGQAFESEGTFVIEALLANQASRNYNLQTSCSDIFQEGMRFNGDLIAFREPRQCSSGTRNFMAGQQVEPTFSWNGTVFFAYPEWEADALGREGEFRPAPAGQYDWTVAVRADASTGNSEAPQLAITFRIAFD